MNAPKKRPNGTEKMPKVAEKLRKAAENPAEAAEKAADGAERGARKDFADELRAWRTKLGLTQVGAGEILGYSGSFVSDIERCYRMPTLELAQLCDDKLDAPGTFVRTFRRISLESFPGWFAPVLPFETQAIKIQSWDVACVPGLLQTADYARALFRAGRPDDPDDLIERDVVARMQRQEIFSREHPLSAWFIIDELALRRAYGSRSIMAAQLGKLIEKSAHPGIVIQIMPIEVMDCSGADGPMTVYDIPGSPQVGFTDGCEVGRIIDEPEVVAKLVTRFDHLRATALSQRESTRRLGEIRSDYSE